MLCPNCRKVGMEVEIVDDHAPCRYCGWKAFGRGEGRSWVVWTYNVGSPTEPKSEQGYISTIGRDGHNHLLVAVRNQLVADLLGIKEEMEKYGYVAVEWLEVDPVKRTVRMAPMLLEKELIGDPLQTCPLSVGLGDEVVFYHIKELIQ